MPAGVDLGQLHTQVSQLNVLPLNLPNLTQLVTGSAVGGIDTAASKLGNVRGTGNKIASDIQRYGVKTLQDIQSHQGTFDDVRPSANPHPLA